MGANPMGMVNALFSFRGRIDRAHFWMSAALAGAGCLVALTMMANAAAAGRMLGLAIFCVSALLFGASLWVGLAAQARRFHDRGRSGWFAAAPMVPFALILFEVVNAVVTNADPAAAGESAAMYALLLAVIGAVFVVDLGCMRGQKMANEYGDPPGAAPMALQRAFAAQGGASVADVVRRVANDLEPAHALRSGRADAA